MIKKYRIRFIVIAMCSTAVVLLLILGAINYYNYVKIGESSDVILDIIVKNGGEFPTKFTPGADGYENVSGITLETPFEARYFSATTTKQGEVISLNLKKIAAITTEDAAKYLEIVSRRKKTSGRIDGYKYAVAEYEGNKLYVFLDCNRALSSCDEFLLSSVIIGTIGLIGVFLLILILSKAALLPIEESYKKQKAFITNASHDIKTPLTVINTEADLINMDYGKNEYADEIKQQVLKLNALTEKLVFLSKMEELENCPLTDFNVSALMNSVIKPYETIAKNKNLNFTSQIEDDVIAVGNEELISKVFSLVLDNAVKYCSKNGNVSVTLTKSGKQCEVSVFNDVDEIESGKHPEFFERFYRGDEARNSRKEGNGIGLSVAKAIMENHKGKIFAESKEGKGVTIYLTF